MGDGNGGGASDFDLYALGDREPIAVFRADGIVEGSIPRTARRISDGLNEAARIRVREEHSDGTPGESREFDLGEVVAVAAAPRPPSSHRVTTRRHPVEIEAGPYRVSGIAHMPPGADLRRYVASTSRRWLPLTDCRVAAGDDEWAVEVVIVNLDHVSRRIRAEKSLPFG